MTDDEFIEVVRAGERNGVEFKGPRDRRRGEQFSEVVRAVLGMANRRDGGLVIIGVQKDGTPTGLDESQFTAWSDRDDVRSAIAPYADPYVEVELEPKTIAAGELQGRHFVILRVEEFAETPVLCAKEGRNLQNELILKIGALYVRSREMEATVAASTQAQMREVLELGVEKGVRKWIAMNNAVGVNFGVDRAPTDDAMFEAERSNFDDGDEIVKRVRTAGYWEVVIRPGKYEPTRVKPIARLFPVLERAVVEIRGWDFPHVDRKRSVVPGQNAIIQSDEWQHHAERWAFYQSGQFVLVRAMATDWRDRSEFWPPVDGWKRGQDLGLLDAFYTLVEIFEFAARLSQGEAGDQRMSVSVKVGGLKGRILEMDDPRSIGLSWANPAIVDDLQLPVGVLERDQLLADPVAPAISAANELFSRFGREFPPDQYRDWLRRLKTRN